MNDRERIVQVLKDQIALCGPDPERDRWWVTFTADDARRILEILSRQEPTQCKDCKRRRTYQCPLHKGTDPYGGDPTEDDWYCGDAERRTDNA